MYGDLTTNAATLDALNNATVRAKTQNLCVGRAIIWCGKITIDGLNFFATQLFYENNGSIVKNCKFQYPSCSKRMLGSTNSPLTTSIDQKDNGDLLSSNDNLVKTGQFINNILAHTDGEAFLSVETTTQ